MKKIALAGNPNCGKTTLFNSLTGSTAHVGNWPGVTVDKREGVYKNKSESLSIVDLPGIYSLSPYTPEEVISRKFILEERPDCIINIVDATNLERNLYLTTQLMEIDVPIVIALNMMDEVRKSGSTINAVELEKKIGLPVVPISALKQENLQQLMEKVTEAASGKRKGQTVLSDSSLKHLINDIAIAFKGKEVENPLFHAVKLCELDELEVKDHADLLPMVEEFKAIFKDNVFGSDFEALVADSRYKYISKNYNVFQKKQGDNKEEMVLTRSDKIDRVLTNRFFGIPIFLVILLLIFHLTFSEDLLFLNAFGAFGSGGLVSFAGTAFEGLFANGGINSPGVILFNLFDIATSELSGAIGGALSGAPSWVSGFIVDGVLGGLFAIISFLPQILFLFLFFSILEDSGYMARVAFILDRIFRRFGLSGRAFMPMIMGFGCSVPAMVNTRTLADENERVATIRVIPFFSCGAKLPILTAIAGGIVQFFGVGNADLITYGMYLLGIVTAIVAVIFMRNTTMRGKVPPFIMELPAYHLPQFKSLMIHLFDKVKHFLKKAFTIILASCIFIWFITHFAWNWSYLEDSDINKSILASIGQLFAPIFTPLGFGAQLTSFGWVFVVAAISGLIAKENVISIFAVLAGVISAGFDGSADGADVAAAVTMIEATGITIPGLLAYIAFNMTTIPCFAAVATAKAELPKKKFATTILFWVLVSLVVSSFIYVVFSWWWTVFIYLVLVAAVVVGIIFFNRYRDSKVLGH